jgi:hypothetical protein
MPSLEDSELKDSEYSIDALMLYSHKNLRVRMTLVRVTHVSSGRGRLKEQALSRQAMDR